MTRNTGTKDLKFGWIASRTSLAIVFLVAACLDPYAPPVTRDLGLLVVDGFLNSDDGVARVKLSRSLPLDSETSYPLESGAVIIVESEDGIQFTLPEISPGIYETLRNDLHNGKNYRVSITTAMGDAFESDYVMLKPSPTLENVFWARDGDGITIYVDALDALGSTRYYQWVYTETWEYDSDRHSDFVVKGGLALPRTRDERIDICYSTEQSSRVLISTTADQSGDVINDFPLTHIPGGSKKLCRTYSILVQQRALDETSFTYWSQLQKTTENLGGLFDPLPSRLTGNVRSTESNGPLVLGYFSGGGVQEKRIYIRFTELPDDLKFVKRRWCTVDTVANLNLYPEGTPLVSPITIATLYRETFPGHICMDCRLEGGTVTKPAFWPF